MFASGSRSGGTCTGIRRSSLGGLEDEPSGVDGPDPADEEPAGEHLDETDDEVVHHGVLVEETGDDGAESGPADVADEDDQAHLGFELNDRFLVEFSHLVF